MVDNVLQQRSCLQHRLLRLTGKLKSNRLAEDFTKWKLDPTHRDGVTFEESITQLESYENAIASIARGRSSAPPPGIGTSRYSEQELQQKFGTLCPNTNCKHREKGKEAMTKHQKNCRFKKTKTNLTIIRVLLGSSIGSDVDYAPILPVSVVDTEEKMHDEDINLSAFCDSGSEYTLISERLQLYLAKYSKAWSAQIGKTKFLVEGVDHTGDGIVCNRVVNLSLRIGDTIVDAQALIVPGLPESLVLGRDLGRAINLVLEQGETPEQNRIIARKVGLDHQMMTKHDYQAIVRKEMEMAVRELEAQETALPTLRTYASITIEEIDEIFERGAPTRNL